MSGAPLAIMALGANSALGGLAPMCAAIRAGVARFGTKPVMLGIPPDDWTDPEPLTHAAIPSLGRTAGEERLRNLAISAIHACIAASGLRRSDLARTVVQVALPSSAAFENGPGPFAASLAARLGLGGSVATVSGSNCVAFAALAEAARQLSLDGADQALVVCVDSLAEVGRLRALDREGLIRSDRSPDGFIPGEGAVALLVRLRDAAPVGARGVIVLGSPTMEPVVDDVRMPSGTGLADALRGIGAADHAEVARRWVLCDLNGSTRRHHDWGVAQTRLGWPPHRLTHSADCLGDVGAVSGGIQIALACEAFHRGWSPSPAAVAWTASDDGTRAAAIISKESLWA